MPIDNKNIIYNLRNEWQHFLSKNKSTQIAASRQLGWSDSFFGSILRGESNLSLKNLVKIANFLKISPSRIDPSYRPSDISSYSIHGTTSGKKPPATTRHYLPGGTNIWADKRVPIFSESEHKSHRIQYFSKGLTLICSSKRFPSFDENFLNINTPYWLILRPKKEAICITSKEKPEIRGAKVLRIVGLHMV